MPIYTELPSRCEATGANKNEPFQPIQNLFTPRIDANQLRIMALMQNLSKTERNVHMATEPVRNDNCVVILAKEYLDDLVYRRYSPATIETYSDPLARFGRYLAERGVGHIQDVSTRLLEDYRLGLIEHEMKEASIDIYMRAVSGLFKYLESKQRIFANPFDGVGPMKRSTTLMPVPTEDDVKAVLAAVDTERQLGIRNRALLETAYSTGARIEELHRLKVADVDMENGTVFLSGKGGKQRVVPLGKEAMSWLKRYITEERCLLVKYTTETAMWMGKDSRPLAKQGLSVIFRRYSLKAKTSIRITPHSLRRACATHMLSHGASPLEIQMLLGHACMRHLGNYLRLTITDIRNMHARSRLGQ